MPIYEFECNGCGKRFERLQKLSDPDPSQCPSCANVGVRRRLNAPAFRLAGSGWYETDFKRDKDKQRNLAGDPEATPAKAETKAETKTDTKAESSTTESTSTAKSVPATSSE